VYSPSGFELPEREQKRKALQQHAEQYSKLFIYSGFGFNYGSNYYSDGGALNISVSPALGYRINDRISIGPGISYTYTNQTFGKGQPTLNLNSLGFKVFAQVRVIDQFFIHGEYETTNVEYPTVVNNRYTVNSNNKIETAKRQIESPLLGVGYRSQISNRVAADIVLLYNFNDNYESIYQNPVLRFNFLFNIGR
jgi:long-subunit fatty acid transport protein